MTITPGQIYACHDYYSDAEGNPKLKYMVVLAVSAYDLVFRLLTSKQNGRPVDPVCFHGVPYPGSFLGVLGEPLRLNSWVDLRATDDYDALDFKSELDQGLISFVCDLNKATLCALLQCAAQADDTTTRQSRSMMNVRGQIACP